MAQEKVGNGTLMLNKRKEKDNADHKNWPDYDGPVTITIAGVEGDFEMAAWKKVSDKETKRLVKGETYLSISIRERWKPDVSESTEVTEDNVAF